MNTLTKQFILKAHISLKCVFVKNFPFFWPFSRFWCKITNHYNNNHAAVKNRNENSEYHVLHWIWKLLCCRKVSLSNVLMWTSIFSRTWGKQDPKNVASSVWNTAIKWLGMNFSSTRPPWSPWKWTHFVDKEEKHCIPKQMEVEMKNMNLIWGTIQRLASDRQGWRNFTAALCASWCDG